MHIGVQSHRPEFHKEDTAFLVAQLRGEKWEKRKCKSILHVNRPLDSALRYYHPGYIFQELITELAVKRKGETGVAQAPGEGRRERKGVGDANLIIKPQAPPLLGAKVNPSNMFSAPPGTQAI